MNGSQTQFCHRWLFHREIFCFHHFTLLIYMHALIKHCRKNCWCHYIDVIVYIEDCLHVVCHVDPKYTRNHSTERVDVTIGINTWSFLFFLFLFFFSVILTQGIWISNREKKKDLLDETKSTCAHPGINIRKYAVKLKFTTDTVALYKNQTGRKNPQF